MRCMKQKEREYKSKVEKTKSLHIKQIEYVCWLVREERII